MQQTKTSRAQVCHQVALNDAKTSAKTPEILSEGELRIVSLAAFLADVTGHYRFQPAKHAYQTVGYASTEYRTHAKSLCSEIRIILERLVEHDLLAEVVLRFRRAIQTDNRLIKLHHINKDDCAFLDGMMTKYSRHEHSQPPEIPISLPHPAEFEEDLYKLKAWQAEFAQRVEGKTPKPGAGKETKTAKKASTFLPPGATAK
jgi:hypothetical protein